MKHKNQIKKTASAVCVALLGAVFILGLTPKSAYGIGWRWPYGKPQNKTQAAAPAAIPIHESEIGTGDINSISATSVSSAKRPSVSGIPVLMYHHVEDITADQRQSDPLRSDLTVSVSDFDAQVKYFKDKGYHSITVAQLYNSQHSGAKVSPKSVVFTFDDGYKDVFVNAVPILQKYGFTGSFAISTELLGRETYAVWDDVIAADHAGMEILSHTENHLDLTSSKYSESDLMREIAGSKEILEAKLNHPVQFFVYPYGHQDERVAALVKAAGYKMAFTTSFGLIGNGDALTEPRVRVHGVDGLVKLEKIYSW